MLIRLTVCGFLVAALGMAGCAGGTGSAEPTETTLANVTSTMTSGVTSTTTTTMALEPIVVPTLPAEIPGYTELDPATGLHMTGTPQVIDLATYRLSVEGKVSNPLSLSYDDLRRLPKVTASPSLVCQGFFTDVANWSGASLQTILEMAGVEPTAERIKMKAADGYSSVLTLEEALKPANFLAYELEGEPLPVLHGFPVRAVIPAKNGNAWVKWLLTIVVE